ncbi:MAG: hypothetical protein KJ563_08225 [Candidatus Thermoplasmatota archaeon]|nr:hypothetical protein [Candidatus Thermoplasmatota archaeon]
MLVGPVFLVLAMLSSGKSTETSESADPNLMPTILAILGIVELTSGALLLAWKSSIVADVFAHGVETRSRLVSYDKEAGRVTFEFAFEEQQQKASKHVFGRKSFPNPQVGQEVVLIVHHDRPDRFVIRDQYL